MTQQAEVTLGEIYRTVQRLEAALSTVQMSVEPIPVLVVRVDSIEARVEKIEPKVDRVIFNAATISGGVAAIAWLLSWLSK